MADRTIEVVVFDLDDTLYLERDYAFSGFAAAGAHVAESCGVDGFADHCGRLLTQGVRGDIFDRALAACGIKVRPELLAALISAYRTHRPRLVLAPDAEEVLARLTAPVALITDGPELVQRGKVAALGLEQRLGLCLPTAMLGPGMSKPHPAAFEQVQRWSGRAPAVHVYVADNAAKDFVAPRRLGWLTVQVLRPERIHPCHPPGPDHAAHHVIESLSELPMLLPELFSAPNASRGFGTPQLLPADHHP